LCQQFEQSHRFQRLLIGCNILNDCPRLAILRDTAWEDSVSATDFWQTQPSDGLPATQRTEVFIGYTNDTLSLSV